MDKSAIDTPDLRPRLPADGGPVSPVNGELAHEMALEAIKHLTGDARNLGYTEAFNRLCAGMSMRDLFALGAMAGDWAAQSGVVGTFANTTSDGILEARAELFYRMADAMLAARVKP